MSMANVSMEIHLSPELDSGETFALAWVKRAWRITPQGLEPDAPPALQHPMLATKQLVPGSDYWPFKRSTDVVVVGSAHAPEHRARRTLDVVVAVGEREKRVRVLGARKVSWRSGEVPAFPEPETFTEIPLAYANAYGGVDARVVDPERSCDYVPGLALADHPGMYPRNPFGRGYVVSPEGAADIDLPFLEDPFDLLTPARFIVGDPRNWHRQPLPAGLGWVHPWMFPRSLYFDIESDAWFPAPDDASLREVREGVLPPGFREILGNYQSEHGPHEAFFQESSLGMRFAAIEAGTPVRLEGVHPAHPALAFAVPVAPGFAWRFEGEVSPAPARLHHLVVEPEALRVSALYATETTLPRTVIPGVHGHIPLALRIDDQWRAYEAPPTTIATLRAAGLDPLGFIRQS